MATFKAEVFKHQRRADGTYNVKIRITHKRITRRIPTPIYVTKDDLTRTMKIKNPEVINQVNAITDGYRRVCNGLPGIQDKSVDEIIKLLTRPKDSKEIDFFKFAAEWMSGNTQKKGLKNYHSAINSLRTFVDRDTLMISEITYRFLSNYAAYLSPAKSSSTSTPNRALSLYLGCIRHLYAEAKLRYNDEESSLILIPWSPFTRFKVPRQQPSRKRALSAKTIRQIWNLPYRCKADGKESLSRYNLAKDMFILSFGLIGMNSVDLFSCNQLEGDTITYRRTKTFARRADHAEIQIKLQPPLQPLYDKYRDHTGTRVFNFYRRFSDSGTFNAAINRGLKEIGRELGIDDLEFYAARHSWATIAVNEVGIDKYDVHAALNHVDDAMRVTDIYIKKSFQAINDANKRVLSYLLDR